MLKLNKKVSSVLCAFAISGNAGFAFPLPKVDFLDVTEGVISLLEDGKPSGGKKPHPGASKKKTVPNKKRKKKVDLKKNGKNRKGKMKRKKSKKHIKGSDSIGFSDLYGFYNRIKKPAKFIFSALRKHRLAGLGIATGSLVVEKLAEMLFCLEVYPRYLATRYDKYRVLKEQLNLNKKVEDVTSMASKVDSIGRGLEQFVKHFSKNGKNSLEDFEICYDNMAFVCYILSLHYKGNSKFRFNDTLTKFCKAAKKMFVPFAMERSDHSFGKLNDVEGLENNLNHYEEKSNDRSWFEFGCLGYDKSVQKVFNVSVLENYVARALNDSSRAGQDFKGMISRDDFGGDGKKVLNITQNTPVKVEDTKDKDEEKTVNSYWNVTNSGNKLNFVSSKATLDGKEGEFKLMFTIPDLKDSEKTKGYDLFSVAFEEYKK